jgi:transcriptional regulator with XRE-family HTH domain
MDPSAQGADVDHRVRSRRQELALLRAELRAKGTPVRQIAQVIQARYNVNSRVAFRQAHGLTQQQVADGWNQLWPSADGEPSLSHKHVSYWEAWPGSTGRAPTPEALNRLARIYRCSAADLLDGEDHTEADGVLPNLPVPVPTELEQNGHPEPRDVLTRVDAFIEPFRVTAADAV